MRAASKVDLIESQEGKIIAVSLAGDYCAEHENGVSCLQNRLGILGRPSRELIGLSCRTSTQKVEDLPILYYEFELMVRRTHTSRSGSKKLKASALFSIPVYSAAKSIYDYIAKYLPKKLIAKDTPNEIDRDTYEDFLGFWDEEDFLVVSIGDKANNRLRYLQEVLASDHVTAFVSGVENPFDRGGLIIACASKIPEDIAMAMKHRDGWVLDKDDYVASTQIKEILLKAGKNFYFLDALKQRQDGEYLFWLNPYDQKRNNHGWYTLHDLLAWSRNEGPIPIK